MAKRQIVQGATSEILEIFISDSSSTTGAGLTGLVYNSGSLTCYYHINTAASAVAVSLVTMTVGTFTSSGFKEIDSTNMPGWYQLCLPDAAYASGKSVSVLLKGAANMAPLPFEIEITQTNNQDGVHGGMTALPNAAAASAGGLPTSGNAAHQILLSSGLVRLTTAGAGDIWDVTLAAHLTAGTTGAALNNASGINVTDIADAILTRDFASVSPQPGLTDRNALQALRFLRNAWTIVTTTLHVKKEDDTNDAWTSVVTTNASAAPITGSDPA